MKKPVLFLMLFLTAAISHAQVNSDIRAGSGRNAENRQYGNSAAKAETIVNAAGCFIDLFRLVYGLQAGKNSDVRKYSEDTTSYSNSPDSLRARINRGEVISNKSRNIPDPFDKFSAQLSVGAFPSKQYVLRPQVAYSGRLFGGEARIYSIADPRINGTDWLSTTDFHLLVHAINEPEFRASVILGAMTENYASNLTFWDLGARAEARVGRTYLSAEGLFAPDNTTGDMVRTQFNASVMYKVNKGEKDNLHAGIVYSGSRWYMNTPVYSVGAGIRYSIR